MVLSKELTISFGSYQLPLFNQSYLLMLKFYKITLLRCNSSYLFSMKVIIMICILIKLDTYIV